MPRKVSRPALFPVEVEHANQARRRREAAMAASKKKVDTTLVVLREIRDAVKGTNVRLDATNTAVERKVG